jgi:hypothetical protein
LIVVLGYVIAVSVIFTSCHLLLVFAAGDALAARAA